MKRVLVACEMSGTVRDAFAARGFYAMSADLQLCHTPGNHYWGNVLDVLYDDWDLVIAHPPCTYLSNVGAIWFARQKGRMNKMLDAARFFKIFLDHPCKCVAVENPRMLGVAVREIGRGPDQYIEPYHYGERFSKKTGLWLKGLPKLVPTDLVEPVDSYMQTVRDPVKRSLTFKGIANAMANQWGDFLLRLDE